MPIPISKQKFFTLLSELDWCERRIPKIRKILYRVKTEFTDDEISELYWSRGMTKVLCNMLGIHATELRRRIKKPNIGNCKVCGASLFANAKTELAGKDTCEKCQKKINDSNSEKWDLDREAAFQETQRLKSLPYPEYLKTEHWKSVRDKALYRAWYRCQLCNRKGQLHVHHRTYRNRGEEKFGDVIVLCSSCHKRHHFDEAF